MNEALSFSPQMGDIYLMAAVCGALFIILVWLAFRLNKNKHPDPRRRVLMPMLSYFMALLALMGFLGSFWSVFKYPEVKVANERLLIGSEDFPMPKPSEMRLESYTGSGLGPATRVLLVQTKDRRTWAFPADRYNINGMMQAMRGE
jgi:hypothetical protein